MDKTSIKKTIAGAILVTAGLVGLEHILNDGQTQTEPLKRSQTIATTPELKVQRYQIKDIPHYEESLWTTYLEAEKDIRTKFGLENKDHDLNKAQNFADTFSKDVSRAVMKSANAKNPVAAAQKISRPKLMQIMAEVLRKRNVVCTTSGLISDMFDKTSHDDKFTAHLDCDSLTFLFAHAGRELDIDMFPLVSLQHAYLGVPSKDKKSYFPIESTAFNSDNGTTTKNQFFTSPMHQAQVAARRVDYNTQAKWRFHKPVSLEKMNGLIYSSIMTSLFNQAVLTKNLDLEAKMADDIDSYLTEHEGAKNHLLCTLAQFAPIVLSIDYLRTKDLKALKYAKRAVQAEKDFKSYLVNHQQLAKVNLAHTHYQLGDTPKARQLVMNLVHYYYGEGGGFVIRKDKKTQARDLTHALALSLDGHIRLDQTGQMSMGTQYLSIDPIRRYITATNKNNIDLPSMRNMLITNHTDLLNKCRSLQNK